MNPLLAIDWLDVKMLSLDDEKTVTVRVDGEAVQHFEFGSKGERDAAFKEWIDQGYQNAKPE